MDNKIKSTGKILALQKEHLQKYLNQHRKGQIKPFKSLHECGSRSAILSVVPPYSEEFVPKPVTQPFSTVLTELRDEDTFDMNFAVLLHHCKGIEAEISVTQKQDATVEKGT